MCLAPQVDVLAGVAIAVVAVDAIRHNRSARTAPLAALPAVFAVHTLASALVWWGLQGRVPATIGDAATAFYLGIAFVLLPVLLPIAVLLIEPPGWRRSALVLLTAAGLYSSLDFLVGLLDGRGGAAACTYYIDFGITGASSYSGFMYVLATCGALLLSGQRPLVVWGLTNALVVALLAGLEGRALPSLWCFWAAASSLFVAWFLRSLERRRAAGEPRPWHPRERERQAVG